jgi:PAS domain S-box-containing protein
MQPPAAAWQWLSIRARRGSLNWKTWLFAGAAYVGLYGLALLVFGDGDARWSLVSRAATLAPGLVALLGALAVWRARLPGAAWEPDGRLRQAWMFWGLAGLLWTAGQGLGLMFELSLRKPAPLPSIVEPMRLAGYVFAALGLLSYPLGLAEHFGRLRLRLDMAVTSGAGAVLGWLVVIRPVLDPAVAPIQVFWATLYPALDLVLLLILVNVYLASRVAAVHRALALLAAALLAFLLADLAMAYLALQSEFRPSGTIGLGWLLAFVLLGLTALVQRAQLLHGPRVDAERWQRLRTNLQALLPVAATLVLAWYALLDLRAPATADRISVWGVALLALLLVARQGVMAGELELRQYAWLVNSAADPAFICDGEGRLQLVNPALLAATGYEPEALWRQPATILFADGVLPLAPGLGLDSVYAAGWSGEIAWRRRDGSEFPVHLALRPVVADLPGRAALVGTAHNLTDVKRQEADLRTAYEDAAAARRALEDMNSGLEAKIDEETRSLSEAYTRLATQNETLLTLDKLKSEFVSLVSHELRAPLTNVSGGIELVLASQNNLPDRTRRTLKLVQSEIQRLTHFVETILDLSALEAGRLRLDSGALDVRLVGAAVAQLLEGRPEGERLRLRLPETLPLAQGDERAMTSVLFHLVDNALKYAPEGEVSVEARRADGRLEVWVRDHGPGMPSNMLEAVFDKFERVNDADNRAVYGHGLGLYIARRLLIAQGGDIIAANAAGGGACFTFWLPVFEVDDAEQDSAGR